MQFFRSSGLQRNLHNKSKQFNLIKDFSLLEQHRTIVSSRQGVLTKLKFKLNKLFYDGIAVVLLQIYN